MKWLTLFATGICLAGLAGCNNRGNTLTEDPFAEGRRVNIALLHWFEDASINNAIITQHTLFPYHFVNNSAGLNELGKRDLGVLATRFKDNPGKLNVRRGEISADLHQARIKTVLGLLEEAGVDKARITVDNALAGGDGMASERVLTILDTSPKGSATYTAPSGL